MSVPYYIALVQGIRVIEIPPCVSTISLAAGHWGLMTKQSCMNLVHEHAWTKTIHIVSGECFKKD